MSGILVAKREDLEVFTPMRMENFFSTDEIETIERIRTEFLQGFSIDSLEGTFPKEYDVTYTAPYLNIRVHRAILTLHVG